MGSFRGDLDLDTAKDSNVGSVGSRASLGGTRIAKGC
jgi:hypothetical protein